MANEVFYIKQGDTRPSYRARCLDSTTPVNLTTATAVKMLMRDASGASVINAAATKDADQTANTGWLTYDWQAGDTATAGNFQTEIEVTWAGGSKQTFPGDRYGTVVVVDDLG